MATKVKRFQSNVERGSDYDRAFNLLQDLYLKKNPDATALPADIYNHPGSGRYIRFYIGQDQNGKQFPCLEHPRPNANAAQLGNIKLIAGAMTYDNLHVIVNGGSMDGDHAATHTAAQAMGMRVQTFKKGKMQGFALFSGKTAETRKIEKAFFQACLMGVDSVEAGTIARAKASSNEALRIEMKEVLDAEDKARRQASNKPPRVRASIDPKAADAVERTVTFVKELGFSSKDEIRLIEGILKNAKKGTKATFKRNQTVTRPVAQKKTTKPVTATA